MEIIVGLIFISLTIAIGFLILFIWSINSGQYDDTQTPAFRILFGDKGKETKNKNVELKQAVDKENIL